MLTDIERIIFIVLSLFALGAAVTKWRSASIASSGAGRARSARINWERRVRRGLGVFLTQRTVLKRRPLASIFHTMIAWGFTFYLLVNVVDVAMAWFADLQGAVRQPDRLCSTSSWPIS